jgi:hypothetical protein
MPSTPFDPHEYAESIGVRILHHHLNPGEYGRWYQSRRLVVLRPGMTYNHERCVLTHELGHEAFAHSTSTRRTEVQADRWAADRLIDPAVVDDIARATSDEGRICAELGITVRLFRVWLYAHGRMPLIDFDVLPSRRGSVA